MSFSNDARVEALEVRTLLAVTVDEHGWTNFGRAPDARIVYVSSSSGSDKNSGFTTKKPVQTLDKARALLRDGRGDWMLLKAGDVFYENLTGWRKSGLSTDYPLLIGSYGQGERPVLETGDQPGFTTARTPFNHVAIVGLLFHAHTRDPDSPSFASTAGSYGVDSFAQVDGLLIENCVFDSYEYNVSIRGQYGRASHIGIRRNVIVDAYSAGGKSQGLYMSRVDGTLIEGNVFDHNGWNERLVEGKQTLFSHNVYLSEDVTNVHIKSNIIANAASHGLQARGGGTIQGNVFLRNPIGLLFGNGTDSRPGGVEGDVSGNVFLGSADIGTMGRGWGLEVGNTKPGGVTVIANNVFAHDTVGRYPAMMLKWGGAETVGVNDVTIEGNVVYRWQKGLTIDAALTPGAPLGPNALSGLMVRNNDFQRLYSNRLIEQGREMDMAHERFQGNRYFSSGNANEWFKRGGVTTSWDQWYAKVDKTSRRVKVKYNDPERSIETYNAMLGGRPAMGAFLTQARLLARRVWDRRYSADAVGEYIRTGFKVRKIPPTVVATNLSSKNTQPTRREIFFLFDKDVSSKLAVDDLVITKRSTGSRVNVKAMKLVYDAATNRASWTFPGLKRAMLAAGEYEVKLVSKGVTDVKGTTLDGNSDGFANDDFVRRLKVKPAV